jgi:hypothetical protein
MWKTHPFSEVGLALKCPESSPAVSRNGCEERCGHGLLVEHHRGPGFSGDLRATSSGYGSEDSWKEILEIRIG